MSDLSRPVGSDHDWTRRGSTGRSTVPCWCTIDVRTHLYGILRCPHWPPADRWRHHRTLLNRSLTDLGGPQILLAQPRLLVIVSSCFSERVGSTCLLSLLVACAAPVWLHVQARAAGQRTASMFAMFRMFANIVQRTSRTAKINLCVRTDQGPQSWSANEQSNEFELTCLLSQIIT